MLAITGPKGLPIDIPSIYLYITFSKLISTGMVAKLSSTISGIQGEEKNDHDIEHQHRYLLFPKITCAERTNLERHFYI